MDKLICKSGNNNLVEKEDTSELEKKIGSILLTLIQKAVVLAAKYSKSSGRDNLSSTDMIYALQYYAHEFNNEENLEDSFVENEIEYEKMITQGYRNIFYIDSKNATGSDNEGTVDGVHFTDLGFIRYADFLIDRLSSLGLINN